MSKLTCSLCLHKSTDEDKVMHYGPAGREQALCVDNEACEARRLSRIKRIPVRQPEAAGWPHSI